MKRDMDLDQEKQVYLDELQKQMKDNERTLVQERKKLLKGHEKSCAKYLQTLDEKLK